MTAEHPQARENNLTKSINVLDLVQKDMEQDAKKLNGQPFDGKTVGTAFGGVMAAVLAVARVLQQELIYERSRSQTPVIFQGSGSKGDPVMGLWSPEAKVEITDD